MIEFDKPLSEYEEVKYAKEIKASDLTDEKKVEIIQSLPQEARWNISAEQFGFIKRPPTITEALEDPYYFGSGRGKTIYPIWREKLREYFPDPFVNKSLMIRLTGAIGTGKSFVSQLIVAYNLIKILHHKSYWAFNRLDEAASPASIWCFNVNLKKAEDVLVKPIKGLFAEVPFFVDNWRTTGKKWGGINVKAGSRPMSALSEVIVNAILSELELVKPSHLAKQVFDNVLSRFTSRVANSTGLFSSVIIDCQTTTNTEPVVDNILKSYPEKITTFQAAHWEAKPWEYNDRDYGPEFFVYCGDTMRSPFVFDDGFEPKNNKDLSLDPDRILKVPGKLKSEFISDPVLALAQKAGIRSDSSNVLFPDKEQLIRHFNIKNLFDDQYSFDYYDKTAYWDVFGNTLLDVLPKDRKIYGSLDLGLCKDTCGISFGYADAGEEVETNGAKVFRCKYKVPFAVGIRNKPGQENNIIAICDFFIKLSNYRDLVFVACDQFQSRQIKQTLLEAGIECDFFSVDRSNGDAYVMYKSLVLRGDVDLPKNSILLSEHLALGRYDGKIDHPSIMSYVKFFSDGTAQYTGNQIVGGKDQSDAVCRLVSVMSLDGTKALDVVEKERQRVKSATYAKLAERNRFKQMQGMLGMYK